MSGTILKPSLAENIALVSKVLHRHISNGDGYLDDDKDVALESKFDVDNFLKREFRTSLSWCPVNLGGSVYAQRKKLSKCEVPSFNHVHKFLNLIFSKLELNVQCAIVGLLYCERLMQQRKIAMTSRNWRPILIVCLLESSKMWDDVASWNVEFSELFPCLGLPQINYLEKLFLQEMGYDLFISGSVYAKYYFALRGLRYTNEHQIPRNYLDFKVGPRRVKLGLKPQKRRKLKKDGVSPSIDNTGATTSSGGSIDSQKERGKPKRGGKQILKGRLQAKPPKRPDGSKLRKKPALFAKLAKKKDPPYYSSQTMPNLFEGVDAPKLSRESTKGFSGRPSEDCVVFSPTFDLPTSPEIPTTPGDTPVVDPTGQKKPPLAAIRNYSDPTFQNDFVHPSTNNLLRVMSKTSIPVATETQGDLPPATATKSKTADF